LASLAALIVELAGIPVVPTLMLSAPIILTLWLGAQLYKENALQMVSALAARLADAVAERPNRSEIAPRFLLSVLPVLAYAGAQVGITPIILVIVLASVFGAMPDLSADPTLLASSLACGWTLAMVGGPFSSLALLL